MNRLPRRMKRLNDPRAIAVQTDAEGTPTAISWRGGAWKSVTLARSPWRVDQHWWRSAPLNRTYYRLDPGDEPVVTVFLDHQTGEWHRQEYTSRDYAR